MNDLKIGNKIKLIFDGKQKIIIIDEFRKTYTNKEYDITIIELKENEFDLNDYLKIDDLMYKENELNKIYKNKQLYIIHYLKDKEKNYLVDKIINIENLQIEYFYSTNHDLSGAPILNLENCKVIGIHTGNHRKKKCNIGKIIKLAIDDFNKKYKPITINEINNMIKDIEKKEIINNNMDQNYSLKNIKENDKLLNKNNINYIIAEIEIKEEDINKNIKIINSFEQCREQIILERNKGEREEDFTNEDDLKKNCEIIINGAKISFSFFYKFNKKGKYIIQYIFKNKISKINNLFYECSYLTKIDFSNFNTQNITNIWALFYECSSLININLSNFNTNNVINMGSMFYNCKALTNINLSSFNTQNLTDMNWMFSGCRSLTNINLSNFNTSKVVDMGYMFYGCSSLTNINLSNFNTLKVVDMDYMFYGCSSLTNINLSNSNFNNQNVIYKSPMFGKCNSLINKYILSN